MQLTFAVMIGLDSRMRWLALTAAVLLLWCHGLDGVAHARGQTAAHRTAHAANEGLSAPVPIPPTLPDLNCCFDGAGATLQAIAPGQPPAPPLPVAVALVSALLGLAALAGVILY